MSDKLPFGVYIHVPFCVSRCGYCDFCRVTDLSLQDAYLKAVAREMKNSSVFGETPRTVYIGGGTPSSLGAKRLGALLSDVEESFYISGVSEYTVECNPDDITEELVSVMTTHGVGRVSMGSQSLSDSMLRFMGRRHDAAQVYRAIETLRRGGIENISVDMIFGLPDVGGYNFSEDLVKFTSLGVPHLSAYALSYEEGSRFSKMVDEGRLSPTPDDIVADQYAELTDALQKAGYAHYEISNYALPGMEARHNSSYWDRTPYWGFGPAASSYHDGVRRTNTYDVRLYIDRDGQNTYEEEVLTEADVFNETAMLRLRTSRGMHIDDVPSEMKEVLSRKMKEEITLGNIVCQADGSYRIPEERWFVADAIIERIFV